MSKRKVYQVLVNGDPIFSGSYQMALCVYEATMRYHDVCPPEVFPSVVIAFKPE